MTDDPLILTLQLDPDSFTWLDDLRRRYFPPERNVLAAHLTLFHKLDADHIARMTSALATRRDMILLRFAGLRSLGGGVAVEVHSPELMKLRAALVTAAAGGLTAQDRQGFRPHVTIQNKVTAAVARDTLAKLQTDFVPREGQGIALQVWRYLGGPWALQERLDLAA